MRKKVRCLILIILVIMISFAGCNREKELNKFTEASVMEKEKLLKEVKVTAYKHRIDKIKEIAQFVEGVVLNEEHKPVSKISVVLEKEDKRFNIPPSKTDSGGCFTFQKIPYGKYVLKLVDKKRKKIVMELNIEVDKKEKDIGIVYMISPKDKKEISNLEELEEEVGSWEKEKIKEEEEFLAKKKDKKEVVKKEKVFPDKSSNKKNVDKENIVKEEKIAKEKEMSLSFHPNDITWDGEYLWVIAKSYIYKINSKDGTQISEFRINILDGSGLTWDGKYLWCSDCFVEKLYKIDPKSEQVVDMYYTPDPGYNHYGMTFDGKYLWYSSSNAKFYKINPESGQTVRSFLVEVGGCHNSLAWDGKYLWSTVWDRGMLYQIDPNDGKIIREFVLDFESPNGIVCIGKSIWISSYYQKKIYELKFE
ncbi:MAG: hypothetical protein QMD92_06310 [bacterium]|nr:hypothetical protein [bacterium]